MELRQLEYFVTVTEEASFTRAADRLHVAQPGVSAQIRQLERELGQPLLDRSGRGVKLTEVGAAVLPHARAALASVAAVRGAVDEFAGLLRGHVTIGAVDSMTVLDMPGLLAGFHRDHPDVEITLTEEGLTTELMDGLRAGGLDLAIVSLGSEDPPGLDIQVVIDTPVVAAVARDDPFAGRDEITLAELEERALICLPRGTGLRMVFDEACAAARVKPRVAFEASDPPTLARLAERGLGVAILPEVAARHPDSRVHPLAIAGARLRGRIALAWRAEGPISPAARALIARARAHLPSPTD
ncbi:LysR family transcriptional regulator [Actinomadura barringtoniae]|uniref:LysR family transcriptional regulator n=1 Tax=Actinomadura barringtoniae TaxID=1427535 RepID=A0A939T1B7_9ACTN|nr:LysR family transcriptional regulator [Actinomadura barringtoniae]MBO2447231.1 LysR family transcriptional regulator [Actinomadura barringtoniae]